MPGPIPIPFPLSSFPGSTPQEAAGRLINCCSEPLGPGGPSKAAYHRQPGLTQFASTSQTGYRGGLIVNNLSYECFSGQAATVDASGNVTVLGAVPGTSKVSIARNQAASPNVVAVDITNGAWVLSGGAPAFYNGGGNLPAVNSVAFLDGYFLFGTASNQVYASGINALTQTAETYITLQAKSDVTGQRVIVYGGLMFGFTSGHCEVWQDTAQSSPGFPFTRLLVIPWGLIQPGAIAGFETGFDNLCWVAQDYGAYNLPPGSLAPTKVSPPDLDRLIEAQVRAGNTLEASCYAFAGKKFWALSSPAWTWEWNLGTQQWNERWSLSASGLQGRWRASGGHPAFGKWLCGDVQSGAVCYIDDSNFTELGNPQLYRIESAPVDAFPNRIRVARADFNFATGVGQATGATPNIVNPTVAVSWSDDDGFVWSNPIYRSLGQQGHSKRTRVVVKNTGISGPQARRWRLDVTDPVTTVLMNATQSVDPREN